MRLHGYETALAETFVSSGLYKGTRYRAVNFTHVGGLKQGLWDAGGMR
jgi:hypothetical protein